MKTLIAAAALILVATTAHATIRESKWVAVSNMTDAKTHATMVVLVDAANMKSDAQNDLNHVWQMWVTIPAGIPANKVYAWAEAHATQPAAGYTYSCTADQFVADGLKDAMPVIPGTVAAVIEREVCSIPSHAQQTAPKAAGTI